MKVGANKKRDVRKVKMTFSKGNRKKAVLVILGAPEYDHTELAHPHQ